MLRSGISIRFFRVVAAIEEIIKSGPRTPDLGGAASTTQVGEAIAARIAHG